MTSPERRRGQTIKAVVAAAAIAVTLAGCASASAPAATSGSFKEAKQDKNSTITVWADSSRLPTVQKYQEENPNVKMKIVTYDGAPGTLQTKVALFDRAGSGWPDVVFTTAMSGIETSTSGKTPFAAPLDQGIFPQSKIDGFAKGALDPCIVNGHLYCIRNDVAQNVFWYNKTLFDQFGYTVPKTWEDLQALSDKVAEEHPGYVLGTVGDNNAPLVYFWASECPANTLDGKTFSSDTSSQKCTRVANLLDHMIANGTVVTDGVFSGAAYTQKYSGKTLALVGPSWYGKYVFDAALKVPSGQMAAAAPLTWANDGTKSTGNVGGGLWWISSHSKNLAASSKLVQWLTTSNAAQESAPTYPAYAPAAKAWLANPENTSYFANDVAPAFTKAAASIWSGWSQTSRVNQQTIWANTILPQLVAKKTVLSTLPTWQAQAEQLAGTVGYTVKK
ncbi:carbohydrate ABC transporter substrate-binding protein [Leifsonia sp. NPDC077715]|uniref:ABC transporter substrate-binding protein n=1 Tax=Leifsonia sp. NPDC077715 TaxID=3155539 RepID=UPI003420C6CB